MSLSNPTANGTLVSIPGAGLQRAIWAAVLVAVGVVVLAVTAQIRIVLPFTPIPITGQTLGVLLLAAAYGSRLAPATVIAYLLFGITGAPVFTGAKFGLATLTGAIIMALGHEHAGLFSNNDDLVAKLTAAGKAEGEPVWRLPMGPGYDKQIDSDVADDIDRSLIREQVEMGVAVRMACLDALLRKQQGRNS